MRSPHYRDAMLVSSIAVHGFRDLPDWRSPPDLPRVVGVRGPGPASTALGDALELAFAALNPDAMTALLRRWAVLAPDEDAEILGAPLPEQVSWSDQRAARGLVASESERHLRVTVELALDPVLESSLRALAPREPRLAAGLAPGARVRLGVGALFTSTFDAVAVSVHELRFGEESFPTVAGQRPAWLTRFLVALAGRFARHPGPPGEPPLAERVLAASTAWEGYGAYLGWQRALVARCGTVRPARGPGDVAVLLSDDLPLRRHGPAAEQRAAQAAAVYLSRADVLWVEDEDDEVDASTEGDGSPLEQIWRVHAEGAVDPDQGRPDEAPSVTPLRFDRHPVEADEPPDIA